MTPEAETYVLRALDAADAHNIHGLVRHIADANTHGLLHPCLGSLLAVTRRAVVDSIGEPTDTQAEYEERIVTFATALREGASWATQIPLLAVIGFLGDVLAGTPLTNNPPDRAAFHTIVLVSTVLHISGGRFSNETRASYYDRLKNRDRRAA